jgi:Fe-S cluster assembly iron-binding protein IscA
MLTVTEAAGVHLAEVLADAPGEAAVRFTVQEQSLAPRLDMPRDNDVIFEHQGRTVLVIEPQLAGRLSDRVLDACETETGTKLVLRAQDSDDSPDQN